MKVSMRQLEYGAKLDFKECFKMEYRMAQRFIADHDFYEGVRAGKLNFLIINFWAVFNVFPLL